MRTCNRQPQQAQRSYRSACLRVLSQTAPSPPKSQVATPSRSLRTDFETRVRAAAQLTSEEVATLIQAPQRAPQASSSKLTHSQDWVLPPSATDSNSVWVFSYGGNMCYETIARRDVSITQRDPAFIVDPSVRMVFKHRGGHATVESLPAGVQPRFKPPALDSSQGQPCVHGVLYRMPAADLKDMESRDQGYKLTQMEVETYEGRRVSAHVWVSAPLSRLPQEVTPPEMYMKKLREGAAFNFLDPSYQAWLSSIQTVTSAGLGSEYYLTPGRYISYSLLLVSLTIVAGWLSQHL